MYNSIVVGTDGSASAAEAVRQAAELARLSGATLHVVCAYTSAQTASAMAMTGAGMAGMAVDAAGVDEDLQRHASEVLDRAVPADLRDELTITRHVRSGAPSDVLIDVAEEEKADVIVVGNKGMTGARRFFLGSVPNRVAHSSPCNVLIVHTT